MGQVLRTAEARADLLEIWVYIAEDNIVAADRVLSAIDLKCKELTESPNLGRVRSDLALSLRSVVEGNYVIFYRIKDNDIQIVRVLHGSRDLRRIFN